MVKKLYKHEILAYWRIWMPTQLVLLGVALLGRVIQLFEDDSTAYTIVNGSSVFVYVVAILAVFGVSVVFAISRFYKNLFTAEGYLSLTLPVTPTQHILVKTGVALLFQVATVITVCLSFSVITAGDMFVEVLKAAGYLLGWSGERFGYHMTLYILEFVLMILVALINTNLLFYTCIALGQRARKNRVLAAVGVYFIYYLISQIFGTVLIVVANSVYDTSLVQEIIRYYNENLRMVAHTFFVGYTLWLTMLSVAYFFITRFVMTHKLNLE